MNGPITSTVKSLLKCSKLPLTHGVKYSMLKARKQIKDFDTNMLVFWEVKSVKTTI